jgi:hypothetical protein
MYSLESMNAFQHLRVDMASDRLIETFSTRGSSLLDNVIETLDDAPVLFTFDALTKLPARKR